MKNEERKGKSEKSVPPSSLLSLLSLLLAANHGCGNLVMALDMGREVERG